MRLSEAWPFLSRRRQMSRPASASHVFINHVVNIIANLKEIPCNTEHLERKRELCDVFNTVAWLPGLLSCMPISLVTDLADISLEILPLCIFCHPMAIKVSRLPAHMRSPVGLSRRACISFLSVHTLVTTFHPSLRPHEQGQVVSCAGLFPQVAQQAEE